MAHPSPRSPRRRAWRALVVVPLAAIAAACVAPPLPPPGSSTTTSSTAATSSTTSTAPPIGDGRPTPPLVTDGADLVDAQGETVTLRGINWFGFETETHLVHGLWARDYRAMLAQIADLGYDTIRLPWSVQAIRSSSISGLNTSLGANAQLAGKTPLQAMDAIIDGAADEGLLVLLDNHRLNDASIPELWYGDGYTEQDWLDSWRLLADRYADRPNVIGADLKNEPHGAATWGSGNLTTDWRLAAERAGEVVLSEAPHWLIVVEGVSGTVPGQQLSGHWWGGNLEAAGAYPVRLSIPHRVVYSPHEYGPGVYDQAWFHTGDLTATMHDRWEKGFGYLQTQDIAPVLVGEFGGKSVDTTSLEGRWQNLFVDWLDARELSFTYWTWNPNSSDTGGVLTDDWTTVRADKQAMLDRLLDG
ncbi:MAG: glycoside hydrolase family 5 protein [Acidimicrobiales bacterium]|nr:glycoside hydrolase family 5 protein [Acidimicrobiales bacterium]